MRGINTFFGHSAGYSAPRCGSVGCALRAGTIAVTTSTAPVVAGANNAPSTR